jgi:hypothetical protein
MRMKYRYWPTSSRMPCATHILLNLNVNRSVARLPDSITPQRQQGYALTEVFVDLGFVSLPKTASPQSQRRFIENFATYTQAVVQQAADHTHPGISGGKKQTIRSCQF